MYSGGLCSGLKRFLRTREIRDTNNCGNSEDEPAGDDFADESVDCQAEVINHGRKVQAMSR